MSRPAILLVGADTARARAYAHALGERGLGPVAGIVYGAPAPAGPRADARPGWPDGLAEPRIDQPLAEIFARNGWHARHLEAATTINAPEVLAALACSDAGFAVFCGRGGEIVGRGALAAGPAILHCHPGRLPAQRGSTTIYYSLLERRPCTVSALLLAPEIDAGPVLAMREYPGPRAGCDVDVAYDCAIRADLLCRVAAAYRDNGRLPAPDTGPAGDAAAGGLYFVVHPVLKHIALLSLPAGSPTGRNR